MGNSANGIRARVAFVWRVHNSFLGNYMQDKMIDVGVDLSVMLTFFCLWMCVLEGAWPERRSKLGHLFYFSCQLIFFAGGWFFWDIVKFVKSLA